jgi:hypothetical protein
MTTDTRPPVGSFYVASYGYDQTNVDFYRVIAHTPKGVKVQRWSKAVSNAYAPSASAIPADTPAMEDKWSDDPQRWTSRPERVPAPILQKRPDRHGRIRINSYAYARPWDGKPQYQTGHGWGH